MFFKKHHILSVEISPAQNLVWGLHNIQLAQHTLKENVMCYSYNIILYLYILFWQADRGQWEQEQVKLQSS